MEVLAVIAVLRIIYFGARHFVFGEIGNFAAQSVVFRDNQHHFFFVDGFSADPAVLLCNNGLE